MSTILETILAETAQELTRRKRQMPLARLEQALAACDPVRDFEGALHTEGPLPTVIAEVKRASPSKGLLREDFHPVEIATAYEAGGAAAISILTNEPHFQGRLEYVPFIRRFVGLPLLRKEFIIDPYQVIESRVVGADAVLLIAAALDDRRLEECFGAAGAVGLHALVEVHTAEELDRAIWLGASLIGINNRDLTTFEVDLGVTFDLIKHIPEGKTVVSESGIATREDLLRLRKAGVDAVLIGESLMRAGDIRAKLAELINQG
ncbi:MAG: indole-3-glycerol phosphate synthase TrpC [Candidatus Tectimicrobiota bacterium]